MKALTRTRSVGGSLIVTIPKEELFIEGELVETEVEKVKKDFFGALRVGHFTEKDELKGQME